MTTRRARPFRRTQARRRTAEWYDVSFNDSIAQNVQDIKDMSTNLESNERKGATIVRTIIDLQFIPATSNVQMRTFLGLVLVELDAFASAVVPDPSLSDDQPGWLYRAQTSVRASSVNDPNPYRLQADIKSRRKFPGEDVLYTAILERDSAVGNVLVTGWIRYLVLKQ